VITVRDDAEWAALAASARHSEWGSGAFRNAADRQAHHAALDELVGAWTSELALAT
jgi:crotonobetainyl-CoA:carnitine CoA-transferase CaiB-like acyl-CoA transferase